MSHNKCCYVKKINKSAAQGSRRVDLMFKQASLKAFTSDFDVCDKDLGINKALFVFVVWYCDCAKHVGPRSSLTLGWLYLCPSCLQMRSMKME